MQPDGHEFEGLVTRAIEIHRSGRIKEAIAAYNDILARSPGHPRVHHNLGVIAATQGNHCLAIGHFDAALERARGYLSAHLHRAQSKQALGDLREAADGYNRVCHLDPSHYGGHRALGFLWLAMGNRGRSLDHFARTYDLRRGEDRTGIAEPSLTHATRDKLMHDAEQFLYLALQGRNKAAFSELARRYKGVATGFPNEWTALSAQQVDELGRDYNTAINLHDAPETQRGAVTSPANHAAIVAAFKETSSSAAVWDGILTPPALRSLRDYLLRSTIWHDFTHVGGFVASYLEDGLACPLLLQIADEVRTALPEILADHPLTQAWAFKGLHPSSTIGPHADDAAVSLNFWITPDRANLDPESGGLRICLEPPPADHGPRDYSADKTYSSRFIEQNRSNILRVGYRENRAVIFHSRLFHMSEIPTFAAGYDNLRINLTLLFGTKSLG